MLYPELNTMSEILHLEGEVWRDIEGYEGVYQVSNLGRVKRLPRTQMSRNKVCSFPVHYHEIVMKANDDSSGYPSLVLIYPTKRHARVHKLVAEAFLVPPSDELITECLEGGMNYVPINHKDENPHNAHVDNLEWCSISYNNTYGKSRKSNPKMSGSASCNAVLNEAQVLEIVGLVKSKTLSQEKIAEIYNVKQITVSNIWTGRSWSHLTGIPHTARVKRKDERKTKKLNECEMRV